MGVAKAAGESPQMRPVDFWNPTGIGLSGEAKSELAQSVECSLQPGSACSWGLGRAAALWSVSVVIADEFEVIVVCRGDIGCEVLYEAENPRHKRDEGFIADARGEITGDFEAMGE